MGEWTGVQRREESIDETGIFWNRFLRRGRVPGGWLIGRVCGMDGKSKTKVRVGLINGKYGWWRRRRRCSKRGREMDMSATLVTLGTRRRLAELMPRLDEWLNGLLTIDSYCNRREYFKVRIKDVGPKREREREG